MTETRVHGLIDVMKKGNMEIKYESNSRVKSLIGTTLKESDVIPRTTTIMFPDNAATVRIAQVRDKNPVVTIHFRGKPFQKTYNYWDYQSNTQKTHSFSGANVMRIGFRLGTDSFWSNGEVEFSVLEEMLDTVNKVKSDLEPSYAG